MADLLVLPRPEQSLQNGAGFSGKIFSKLGLLKRKRWPRCQHLDLVWRIVYFRKADIYKLELKAGVFS